MFVIPNSYIWTSIAELSGDENERKLLWRYEKETGLKRPKYLVHPAQLITTFQDEGVYGGPRAWRYLRSPARYIFFVHELCKISWFFKNHSFSLYSVSSSSRLYTALFIPHYLYRTFYTALFIPHFLCRIFIPRFLYCIFIALFMPHFYTALFIPYYLYSTFFCIRKKPCK